MAENKISPQGYKYGSEPYSDHPFWEESSDEPTVVGSYVKTVSLNVDSEGKISMVYTDQDDQTHTLMPSWNEKGEQGPQGERGATGAEGPQGETGPQGEAGVTPVITASATVDETTGTPKVTVTKDGTLEAPNFSFDFSGLKGETGPQGEAGATGAQGPQGETGPQGEAGSNATVSVTKELSGNILKQTITSGENNYETDFPADYVTDVTNTDVTISDATSAEVENDLQNVTPQLMKMNIATAIRTDESTLTEGSHEIVTGVAFQTTDAASSDSYLYFLCRVYSENNVLYAQYYRQSDNSYLNVKLGEFTASSGTLTPGTERYTLTIGDNTIYIPNKVTQGGLQLSNSYRRLFFTTYDTTGGTATTTTYAYFKVIDSGNNGNLGIASDNANSFITSNIVAHFPVIVLGLSHDRSSITAYRVSSGTSYSVDLNNFVTFTITNEGSGTDGINKVTIKDNSFYIQTEPKAITGITQTEDTENNTKTTSLNMAGTNQSGDAVSESVVLKLTEGGYSTKPVPTIFALAHNNLNEESGELLSLPLYILGRYNLGLMYYTNPYTGTTYNVDNNPVVGTYARTNLEVNDSFSKWVTPTHTISDLTISSLILVTGLSALSIRSINSFTNTSFEIDEYFVVEIDKALADNYVFVFSGKIIADEYTLYVKIYKPRQDITISGSNATFNITGSDIEINRIVDSSEISSGYIFGGKINLTCSATISSAIYQDYVYNELEIGDETT